MFEQVKGAANAVKSKALAVVGGSSLLAGQAMAQGTTFDTTAVTTTITAVVTAAAIIGAAALAMHYGIRAWKWLRGAG